MTEDAADQVVRWTARMALLLYAAALASRFPRRGAGGPRLRAADICYLAGLAVYLVHVACAFGLLHGWSHDAAYEHTARRTAETIGWSWGGGLWFNYLLTAAWMLDGLWLALRPESYRSRDLRIDVAMHGFLLFMAVNATVVFGPPLTRWIALGILAAVSFCRRRKRAPA
ncbi:MAG: hypothetical protein J0M17_21905 [Planctomycetes bacterium]|nr:hypothetical protein [Planctomycetota bacterium]